MDLWYVEDKLSPKLPKAFYEWLSVKATNVFLPEKQELMNWQKNMKVIRYASEAAEGINLNDDFLNSLNLANRVITECELSQKETGKSDKICMLINNGNVAIAHFLIQNFLCKHHQLSNLIIVVIQEDELSEDISYKFPDYWVSRRNESSIFAAHGVVTWNKDLYESLHKCQQVLLLNQESKSFEYMIDWIGTKLSLNRSLYPSVHKFQKKINYELLDGSEDNQDLLSVIVPFYNMGSLILETIQSIKKSTYHNIEIIVVNDGSDNEESKTILETISLTMSDISIINIVNQGLSNARNVGAKAARGKYISFLDSDDLVDPLYYEKCIRILDHYANVSFVYSWVQFFGLKKETWVTFDTEFPLLLLTNMLSAFPVIRRKHFLEYGLNKTTMDKGMEDYESWISLMENGCRGVSIPEPLVFYRIRIDSMSRKFNRESINKLYCKISNLHSELYEKYGNEIFKLVYYNGPGYMWNNPAVSYSELTYGNLEESPLDNNQVKYELLRLANSKMGKVLVGLFFKLKLNKLFR